MKIKNIKEAQEFVGDKYQSTDEVYPTRALLETEKQKLHFDLRHSALHACKLSAKFADIAHESDHGEPLDLERARDILTQMQINVLIIANRLDIDIQDILSEIPDKK